MPVGRAQDQRLQDQHVHGSLQHFLTGLRFISRHNSWTPLECLGEQKLWTTRMSMGSVVVRKFSLRLKNLEIGIRCYVWGRSNRSSQPGLFLFLIIFLLLAT